MDRNGTVNTQMMSAREEIDTFISSLMDQKVEVFLQRGKYGEYVRGTLKLYDGNRVLVGKTVCFLGPSTYISKHE